MLAVLTPRYDDVDDDIHMYMYIFVCMYVRVCVNTYTCIFLSERVRTGENDAFPWQLYPSYQISLSLHLSRFSLHPPLLHPSSASLISPPLSCRSLEATCSLSVSLYLSHSLSLSVSVPLSFSFPFSPRSNPPSHRLSVAEENYSLSILEASTSPDRKTNFLLFSLF